MFLLLPHIQAVADGRKTPFPEPAAFFAAGLPPASVRRFSESRLKYYLRI